MPITIGTTTFIGAAISDAGPFAIATINKYIARLSDGALVAVYIKNNEELYYAISTNDGVSWTETQVFSSSYTGVTIYEENDDLYVYALAETQTSGRIAKFTYDSETQTYSIGTWYTLNNGSIKGGAWGGNIVKFNNQYHVIASYYIYNGIKSSYSDSPSDTWTTNDTGSGYDYQSSVAINMSDRVRVFSIRDDDIIYTDLTYSGSYSWSAYTTIHANEGINTASGRWMSAKYIADDDIHISWRDGSNQWKTSHYDGSSWSSPTSISNATYAAQPVIFTVGELVYIGYRVYDGIDSYDSYEYRVWDGSAWGTATTLLTAGASESLGEIAFEDGHSTHINYFYTVNDGASPFNIYFDSLKVATEETIDVEENLNLSESDTLNLSQETINVNENLALNDTNDLSATSIDINESLILADTNGTIRHAIDVNENLTLNDSQAIDVNEIEVNESLTLSDTISLSTIGTIEYISKILSYNPLIVITDTNPVKIAEIDVSDPDNPTWDVYTIYGCSNANAVSYNSITGYLYAVCDSGQVVKILASNLNSYTIIDTLDTDNLILGEVFSTQFKNFAITDDVNGEIITIDEASFEGLSLDIRYLQNVVASLGIQINTVLAKSMPMDIRYVESVSTQLGLDIRWLKYAYSEVSQHPISQADWVVKINDIDLCPLDDIDMKSIVIQHNEGAKSVASFVLHRVHDKLNYRNDGVASEITNNNTVKIYIAGRSEPEFDGKISSVEMNSEAEQVTVTAKMDEPDDTRNTVNIPIPSVNEQLNLYHCLSQNISIDNPYVDALDENPEYYKGIKIDLGKSTVQRVTRYTAFTDVASEITDGTFSPRQNWSYFWLASIKYLFTGEIFGKTASTVSSRYVGPSLQAITSDVIELVSAHYCYQRVYEDIESEMGYHYVGEAPYLEISSTNGKYLTKTRWEDKEDGLYAIKDESYDYVEYSKQIAALEYEKIQNINGDVLPITNADMVLTLDGYYFYNIHLLTRINLSNTTTSGIYQNMNGFPVAVKSIRISSNDMKVYLSCDNQKSQKELDEIDERYPEEEDFKVNSNSNRVYRKYDIANKVYIS